MRLAWMLEPNRTAKILVLEILVLENYVCASLHLLALMDQQCLLEAAEPSPSRNLPFGCKHPHSALPSRSTGFGCGRALGPGSSTGALRETGTFGMGAMGVGAGNTVTRLASEAAKSCTAPPRVRLWSEPKCGNLVRPQRNGHHLAVTNYDRVQCRMLCRARCLGLGKSRRRWSTANWRGRHRSRSHDLKSRLVPAVSTSNRLPMCAA